jgi:hypothetical protein
MLLCLVTEPARDFCYASYCSFLILFSVCAIFVWAFLFHSYGCCDECGRLEIFQTLLSGHFMISVKFDFTSDYWGVLKCHDNIPVIQIAGGGWSEKKDIPALSFKFPDIETAQADKLCISVLIVYVPACKFGTEVSCIETFHRSLQSPTSQLLHILIRLRSMETFLLATNLLGPFLSSLLLLNWLTAGLVWA